MRSKELIVAPLFYLDFPTVTVRPAVEADLPGLNDLYNDYVANAHYTFDVEPISIDARREWFSHYASSGRYRVFVAVEGDSVVGYASSSRYRIKPAYETSIETSIYLAPEATGKGSGTKLYTALFDALRGEDVHRAYAGISLPNPASIALHEKFGFKRAGLYTEQGRKFGRYWDVAWYEKALGGLGV
jgi:phosphinothricin acetyltransferase